MFEMKSNTIILKTETDFGQTAIFFYLLHKIIEELQSPIVKNISTHIYCFSIEFAYSCECVHVSYQTTVSFGNTHYEEGLQRDIFK